MQPFVVAVQGLQCGDAGLKPIHAALPPYTSSHVKLLDRVQVLDHPPQVLLVLRDVYLLYGAYVLEHERVILPVTYTGKMTTAVLLAGFSSLIARWPLLPGLGVLDSGWLPGLGAERVALGIWFVYAGIVLSVAAAIQYTIIARRAIGEARGPE